MSIWGHQANKKERALCSGCIHFFFSFLKIFNQGKMSVTCVIYLIKKGKIHKNTAYDLFLTLFLPFDSFSVSSHLCLSLSSFRDYVLFPILFFLLHFWKHINIFFLHFLFFCFLFAFPFFTAG